MYRPLPDMRGAETRDEGVQHVSFDMYRSVLIFVGLF